MQYVSTRGQAPALGFLDAMLAGLARDGGLYSPAAIPQIEPAAITALAGLSYSKAAARLVAPFVGDELSRSELEAMAEDAYRGFRNAAKAPLVQIDDNLFLLELFHGPTLAFKDFAMQWLGRLMNLALARRDRRAVIVGQPPATPAPPRSRRSAAASGPTCSFSIRMAAFRTCSAGR